MKDLDFILRRISNVMLAEMLGLQKANISLWKTSKKIPRKHHMKIKEIKNELIKKGN